MKIFLLGQPKKNSCFRSSGSEKIIVTRAAGKTFFFRFFFSFLAGQKYQNSLSLENKVKCCGNFVTVTLRSLKGHKILLKLLLVTVKVTWFFLLRTPKSCFYLPKSTYFHRRFWENFVFTHWNSLFIATSEKIIFCRSFLRDFCTACFEKIVLDCRYRRVFATFYEKINLGRLNLRDLYPTNF